MEFVRQERGPQAERQRARGQPARRGVALAHATAALDPRALQSQFGNAAVARALSKRRATLPAPGVAIADASEERMGSVALQRVPQGLTAAAIGGVAGAALGYVLGTGLGVGGSLGLAVGATLGGLAAGAYAHLAGPAVSADVAAERIHLLLANNPAPGQQVNYCTALTTSGDIYISKVKGVTANTAYLTATIGPLIRQANLHVGRSIFLAQEFNKDVGSNHAEMCIMAAACASGHQLTVIYCTGPHCAFCACMMRKAGIRLGAAGGGVDQEGWAHPFVPVSFGSQSGDTRSQLRALDSWRLVPSEDEVTRAGQEWRFSHPRGKSTRWL